MSSVPVITYYIRAPSEPAAATVPVITYYIRRARRAAALVAALGLLLAAPTSRAQAAPDSPSQPPPAPALPSRLEPPAPKPALAASPAPAATPPASEALPGPHHVLGLDVGLYARTVRDDLLVPVTATGGGLDLGGRYEGLVGPGILFGRLGLRGSIGFDRFGGIGAWFAHGVRAGYLPIVSRSSGWSWALGPAVGWEGDVYYFNDWDDAHAYWLGSRWLGAAARAWGGLGERWRLDVGGELGLVGLVGRPPDYRKNKQDALETFSFYVTSPQRNARAAWLGNWQLLRLSADLRSAGSADDVLARGWGLGAELRFIHASFPATAFGLEFAVRSTWAWSL